MTRKQRQLAKRNEIPMSLEEFLGINKKDARYHNYMLPTCVECGLRFDEATMQVLSVTKTDKGEVKALEWECTCGCSTIAVRDRPSLMGGIVRKALSDS